MARKKKYDEGEVIEKALTLFWYNGYDATSTRMLEKEMGINQFSIYASFGNKEGVLLECLKLYKQKIKVITSKLENSNNAVIAIKEYFKDFIQFSREEGLPKGCLITNTINELGNEIDSPICKYATNFTEQIRTMFFNNLKKDASKSIELLNKQADYLIVSMASLATSSKIFPEDLINTYIEHTFNNI